MRGATWEEIGRGRFALSRMRTPGGWLVTSSSATLTFVPDPAHRWLSDEPEPVAVEVAREPMVEFRGPGSLVHGLRASSIREYRVEAATTLDDRLRPVDCILLTVVTDAGVIGLDAAELPRLRALLGVGS